MSSACSVELSATEAARLIDAVRAELDQVLVGQEAAKQALLIAVLAREHVLLEGSPGCGKSELAERGLKLFGGVEDVHLYSFHRDTKKEDLLGEVVLRRTRATAVPGLERLSFETVPGPMLTSPFLVLDNLGRAPGEALAPLLHLLGGRRIDGIRWAHNDDNDGSRSEQGRVALPLETAVATLGLADLEISHNGVSVEPLEPSQLDRFALQVRLNGLVNSRAWRDCRTLISGQTTVADGKENTREASLSPVWNTEERHQLQGLARSIPYESAARAVVSDTLERLARSLRRVEQHSPGANLRHKGLLSDRVFGATLPKLLRAHALVRGGDEVAPEDLRVLRLMVAQRLPKESMDAFEELLEEAIHPPAVPERPDSQGSDQGLPLPMDFNQEMVEDTSTTGQIPGGPTTEADLPEAPPMPPRRQKPRPADVEPLIRAFEGRLDRGRSDLDDDPGGQPRGFRPLRRFDEILDADPLDALLLVDGTLAGAPRVLRRRRRTLGGAVIVARDVSSSMAGFRNDWASELICGLVKAAAKRRMRVGYLEFHQRAMPRQVGGRLLHRAYQQVTQMVREARPMGQTNYEAPLRMALEALRGRRGSNRHVVLLTDGLPILGDTQVRAERALAKRLGVNLHTVFIGDGESPAVLDAISKETSGLRFQAKERGHGLVLSERGKAPVH